MRHFQMISQGGGALLTIKIISARCEVVSVITVNINPAVTVVCNAAA